MSRRTGQLGNVFQHCKDKKWKPTAPAYGRYWIDVPGSGERKRRTVPLGVCTTRSTAQRKLREHIEAVGINSKQTFAATTAPATTFRVQAAQWIRSLSTRRRKPVKPATIFGWQHALDKWMLPNIGDKLLAEVSNGALRELVEKMATAGLSAKSIVNYCAVVKLVVASAVDAEGEQIHPRKWNGEFVGIPIVDKTKQHRPTLTASQVAAIVSNARERYKVLFALLAGTALRIGEALALKATDLGLDCRVVCVQRSIWKGREQDPKTSNAVRSVDVAEPLAWLLREYAGGKKSYLFATASGRPLAQRNVLRVLHRLAGKIGFNAFRRFRIAVLRRAHVPEDLLRFWVGHDRENITDRYAEQLLQDVQFRQGWAQRVGLGFQLGYVGLQSVVPIDSEKVA